MNFTKYLIILLLFFNGCTIPETLYITNSADDVCIITIKLASNDRNLAEIQKATPYLALSERPVLKIKKETNITEFNKKLEYKVVNNSSVEIHLPAKSSVCFPMTLARPGTIDSICFKSNNKEELFSRKTFRKSFEKPANKNTGYLYVFRD